MEHKCLICNEILEGSKTKKSRGSDGNLNLISDSKFKFVITSSQYTILRKVLTLPNGVCQNELINGPYCRECFTNINNVCHCMSALENLQQSVEEFRKDFGSKMKTSCDGVVSGTSSTARKRKSGPSDTGPFFSIRTMILDYLENSSFKINYSGQTTDTEVKKKPKHIHEIISNIDPEGSPATRFDAKLIVRTTNGNLDASQNGNKRLPPNRGTPKQGTKTKSPTTKVKTEVGPSGRTLKKAAPKTAAFRCEVKNCHAIFLKESSLKSHSVMHRKSIVTEDSDLPYSCWFCKMAFAERAELRTHERLHKKAKPIKSRSKSKGVQKSKIVGYIKTSDSSKTVSCTSCDRTFPSLPSYCSHRRYCRKPELPERPELKISTGRRKIECKTCFKVLPNYSLLRAHESKVHGIVPETTTANEAVEDDLFVEVKVPVEKKVRSRAKAFSDKTKAFRPGRCKICVRIVTDISSHMKSEHPDAKKIEQPTTRNSVKSDAKDEESEVLKSESDTVQEPDSTTRDSSASSASVSDKTTTIATVNTNDSHNNESKSTPTPDVETKTETDEFKVKSNGITPNNASTPIAKDSTVVKKPFPLTVPSFKIPPLVSLPHFPTSQAQGSKYQFKNLLNTKAPEKQ